MRNLKLSFALIVAIAAIGITAATKASNLGVKAITDCFVNLSLTNGAGSTNSLSDGLPAATAQARAVATPYVTAVSVIKNKALCPDTDLFCCAEIQITTAANAPVVTIEGVTNKFAIKQLYFRN